MLCAGSCFIRYSSFLLTVGIVPIITLSAALLLGVLILVDTESGPLAVMHYIISMHHSVPVWCLDDLVPRSLCFNYCFMHSFLRTSLSVPYGNLLSLLKAFLSAVESHGPSFVVSASPPQSFSSLV